MFSHVKKWDKEDIKLKNNITKCLKIQLNPNKYQIKQLNKFLNDSRYIYNQGINLFNNYNISNFQQLRNILVTKERKSNDNLLIPDWLFSNIPYINIPDVIYDTPKSIRAQELKVLSENIKSAFSNLKNKNINYFKLNYKSKKRLNTFILNDEKSTSSITNNNNKEYLNISKLKNILIKRNKKDKIKYEITTDIKIQKNRLNKWFLILPYKKEINNNNSKENICALDPGFRTFQTGIDLQGNIFKIGDNVLSKLNTKYKINEYYQSILAKIKKCNKSYKEYRNYMKTKYNFYISKLKITNYIQELHKQTCNYLVNAYDKIILPKFETSKMLQDNNKRFNKMVNSLSHYQFQMRLANKCKENNKKLLIVNEAYTSKACSNCDKLNLTLGKSKEFNCNFCKKRFDRDENASYNILKNVLNGCLKIYS